MCSTAAVYTGVIELQFANWRWVQFVCCEQAFTECGLERRLLNPTTTTTTPVLLGVDTSRSEWLLWRRVQHWTVESYTVMLTVILTIIWYSITHSLFHSRLKTFLFCKSFLTQPFLFLLQDSLGPTWISQTVYCYFWAYPSLLFSFSVLQFIVVVSVRYIKPTHVGFRAHVKITSRIVSYTPRIAEALQVREHCPWTRPVNTDSVYGRALVASAARARTPFISPLNGYIGRHRPGYTTSDLRH